MIFDKKRILITGGTGSLGRKLLERILTFKLGKPKKIVIFSRDESKQHQMRLKYKHKTISTDEIIYGNANEIVQFVIGDIRDSGAVFSVLKGIDIVINAAALKQVPTCEYFPIEAVETNIYGAQNIVEMIARHSLPVETVVGISTDKACKPVNVMGMTKSIQERIFIQGNIKAEHTCFICVRYGNVLISRGSVVPLFHQQIKSGGPVTITGLEMTRFLLSLDDAADIVFAAISDAMRGEIFIPKAKSAKVVDIADIMIGELNIEKEITGIRPGEKIHEILFSEEEMWRTEDKGNFYVIKPILPELCSAKSNIIYLKKEYSSADNLMSKKEIFELFKKHKLLIEHDLHIEQEN